MEIIGVDTGGTFTDFIYKQNGQWGVFKLLSTPSNPAESVLQGLKTLAGPKEFQVVHGSTVATNALLERKGAVTALVTNKGFEDIVAIGRQNRSELYNPGYRRPTPMVPPSLCFGVDCRITSSGERERAFDENSAAQVAKQLEQAQVESVAVCFLFSYLNPEDEIRMGRLIRELNIPVSLSHRILAEFREYERTSTTLINAYVSPIMRRYILHIQKALKTKGFRIMQSNGGTISGAAAMEESVKTILSGPAGGAVGAFETGKLANRNKLISFDMGGTSTDVALLDGALPLTSESSIAGFPVKVPMIDIHTVGAGGGSVLATNDQGALKVGPESAGAYPGPICYGTGERITVTDANLFLGRLVPDHFLGGAMELDFERLKTFFKATAEQTGLTPMELAQGVIDVANAVMEKAIRVISVERGFDPSEFTLFSFGGAGGLHAVDLARLMNIPTVMVPKNPGTLSAMGMLMADVIKDYSLTVMLRQEPGLFQRLDQCFAPLTATGVKELGAEGFDPESVTMEKYLDMRYKGQSFELMVPFDGDYEERFHRLHEKSYGYASRDKEVEIVNIRTRARGVSERPGFDPEPFQGEAPDPKAFTGKRRVIFDGAPREASLILRDKLRHGNRIPGPAIILEYSATVVIPPGALVEVDSFGNLIITCNSEEAAR
ncbi:MAG: hydantoinase/oxoprolinase family protein [Desulfobacteraceae bacterium]|nr:hydantoinase/oxoprolinase family protein [Desulfobacteraceae bacterium]